MHKDSPLSSRQIKKLVRKGFSLYSQYPPIDEYYLICCRINDQQISSICRQIDTHQEERSAEQEQNSVKTQLRIYLRHNKITEQGILRLVKNSHFTNIVILYLDDNNLGNKGCQHLSKSNWSKLQALNLSSNNISSEGCYYLLKAAWTCLKWLSVSFNPIAEQDCLCLSNTFNFCIIEWES